MGRGPGKTAHFAIVHLRRVQESAMGARPLRLDPAGGAGPRVHAPRGYAARPRRGRRTGRYQLFDGGPVLAARPLLGGGGVPVLEGPQQRPHVLLHGQHVHGRYVEQQVEIVDGCEELVRVELREVLVEGVEVLDVPVQQAVFHRERLLCRVRVEGVGRGDGGGGRHVQQEVLDGEGAAQAGHFVAVGVFFLKGAKVQSVGNRYYRADGFPSSEKKDGSATWIFYMK
jgi:hypothetical protein